MEYVALFIVGAMIVSLLAYGLGEEMSRYDIDKCVEGCDYYWQIVCTNSDQWNGNFFKCDEYITIDDWAKCADACYTNNG